MYSLEVLWVWINMEISIMKIEVIFFYVIDLFGIFMQIVICLMLVKFQLNGIVGFIILWMIF